MTYSKHIPKFIFIFIHSLLISSPFVFSSNTTTRLEKKERHRVNSIYNSNVPTSVTPDFSKAVGEIPISSGSTCGTKTYKVPLEIAPGVNGFQPELELSYNSMQGFSTLGFGWSVCGLSSIARSGKSIYFDSECRGVLMDNSDSFLLDGMRLIKIPGNSSPDYILYESEQGHIKAKGYTDGEKLNYFEVFYPNGNIGIFGYPSDVGNKTCYPLTSLTDMFGNEIMYTYESQDNFFYIKSISYNTSRVEFFYSNFNYKQTVWTAGQKTVCRKILSDIICKTGDVITRTYRFTHDNYSGVPLLKRIDCRGDDEYLNPLTFYYGDGETDKKFNQKDTQLLEWYNTEFPSDVRLIRGKFNYGSNVDALVSLPSKSPYSLNDKGDGFENMYSGQEKIFLYTDLGDPLALPMPSLVTESGFIDLLCADLKGNMEENIVKINNYPYDFEDRIDFHVYESNLYTGVKKRYTRSYQFDTQTRTHYQSVQPKFYYSGDFDGDGKTEILAISVHEPLGRKDLPSMCCIFDLESDKIIYNRHLCNFNISFSNKTYEEMKQMSNRSDKIIILDYDGDGKSDLCHINDSGITVYTFRESPGGLISETVFSSTKINLGTIADRQLLAGDLNGDGLTDLAVSPPIGTAAGGSQWRLFHSLGNGDFVSSGLITGPMTVPNLNDRFILHDINGDEKADIVSYNKLGFECYMADDDKFFLQAQNSFPSTHTIIVPVDHNSGNSHTQLITVCNGTATLYSFTKDLKRDVLLTGVVNSFGVIERNEYGFTDSRGEEDEYYQKGSDAVYPYINIAEPLSVVTHSETILDGETVNETDFTYSNAVFHRQGRGFCGFEKISCIDERGHVCTQTFDPYNFTVLKEENSPKGSASNSYRIDICADKRVNILLDRQTTVDKLKNISTTSSFVYNDFGLPVLQSEHTSDDISLETAYKYADCTEIDNPDTRYNLGFVISRRTTHSRDNSNWTETEEIPEYLNRQPLRRILFSDGNRTEQTVFTYNELGLPIAKEVRNYDSPHVDKYCYEYDHAGNLVKTIDPKGLTTRYYYNGKGLLETAVDYRGNKTAYEYDSFGRQIRETSPDGTQCETSLNWESGESMLFSSTETITGKPTVIKTYDSFNRITRESQKRFDGSMIVSFTQYDNRGNVIAQSIPAKSVNISDADSNTLWRTICYDSYDRVFSQTEPTGKQTTFQYKGTAVVQDDGLRIRTDTYDSSEKLISVKDSEGELRYDIDADGKIKKIYIKPLDRESEAEITYGYDKYRRLVSTDEPAKGLTLLQYDASGHQNTRTDASGKTTGYQYDPYGRIVKISFEEFESVYSYDEWDQLVSITSSNGTSKQIIYDNLGRVVSEREHSSKNMWLQRDYTYADGRIETVTYTSNYGRLTTETYVYQNGYLTQINLPDGESVYKLEEENAWGIPSKIISGKLRREYSFDRFGLPSGRMAKSEDRLYQHEIYEFDSKTSNLLSRGDLTTGLSECFEYDNQHRLLRFQDKTAEFKHNGNISEKSDVGIYKYELSGNPYAVSSVVPFDVPDKSLADDQSVEYTSFSRSASIQGNGHTATFSYNSDGERVAMSLNKNGRRLLERNYLGNCYECDHLGELAVNYVEKLYLGGDYYSAPAVLIIKPYESQSSHDTIPVFVDPEVPVDPVRPLGIADDFVRDDTPYITSRKPYVSGLHQILRDYLGSIVKVIQPDGTVVENLTYDAWGRPRVDDYNGCYYTDTDPPLYLGRGYTGHEHLLEFGLVNMNARLYDPWLGRFLSPDPYVSEEDWLQAYNPYSYALNNPLRYSDPDGEVPVVVVCGVAAGIINVATHWNVIKQQGGWAGVKYFLVGAAAGMAGASSMLLVGARMAYLGAGMACTGIKGGLVLGAISGFTEGFIGSFGNSLIEGANVGKSLLSGLLDGAIGSVAGALSGAIGGGCKALLENRNVWTGKKTTEQVVNEIAKKADQMVPQKGHVGGSLKHSKANKMLTKWKGITGEGELLMSEKNYEIGETGRYIRPDVVDEGLRIIYDFKFGYKGSNEFILNQSPQMIRYRKILKEINGDVEFTSKIIHIK